MPSSRSSGTRSFSISATYSTSTVAPSLEWMEYSSKNAGIRMEAPLSSETSGCSLVTNLQISLKGRQDMEGLPVCIETQGAVEPNLLDGEVLGGKDNLYPGLAIKDFKGLYDDLDEGRKSETCKPLERCSSLLLP